MKIDIKKTLCKQCENCQEFTYQRTITAGKRKGEVFKFKYCAGNADIIKIGNWGPDTATLKHGKKITYVCSTKRHDGRARHFEYFLKTDKNNVILHLEDSLDLRMKKLREISKTCVAQTIVGHDSIFPGVTKHQFYKGKDAGKNMWMARVKHGDVQDYQGTHPTELEAAHAYYTRMEELGQDINKETLAYKTYEKWLQLKKFTENEFEDLEQKAYRLLNTLEKGPGNVDESWIFEIFKLILQNKFKR